MAHLTHEQLLRFTLGTLEKSLSGATQSHLDTCTECHERHTHLAQVVFATTVSSPAPTGQPTQPDRPAAKVRSVDALAKGKTLGRYVLLDRLGVGGMGEVFAAFDPHLDRKVALKLLRGGATGATEGRARLLREAQAMARLQHPNVAAVHDVGTFDERVFVAMEFIEGETLSHWMRDDHHWRDVIRMFLQAGSGLAAAHQAGLIHRDFKPDNVLIGRDGRPRVLDFGLARQANEPSTPLTEVDKNRDHSRLSDPLAPLAAKLTLDGAVMGTPGYMAPEQLAGLPTDGRCDQFAFSVALYEALYGRRPFGGETLRQYADEINRGHLPPPPANSSVPDPVFSVIRRGLCANPDDRYPHMGALLAALRPRRRRSKRTIATIVTLGVVATFGIGYAVWSSQRLRVCSGAEERLVNVWDNPTKHKLKSAFLKTGSGLAAQAWGSTAKTLDAWAREWVNGSRVSCEAARLRKVDSPAVYEMKTACLEGRLQRLRALTQLFENADRDVVGHAAAAAASLEPVTGCFDLEALTHQPVPDERVRVADARLHLQVVEARALYDAGKYARGVDLLRSSVTADSSARAQAEGSLWLGRLLQKNGDAAQARAVTLQAAEQAIRAGDAGLQALAFSRLSTGGSGFNEVDEPSDDSIWASLAHAAASRVPVDWQVQYELALNDALISLRNRRVNDALSQFERALALAEEHRGPSHPEVASMHDHLGVAFSTAGNFTSAIEQFDRSFTLHVALEGPEHPNTAVAEGNLADALQNVGRLREAIEHDEHALGVQRAALGETHPETLKSSDRLAKALLAADRLDEALSLVHTALEARTRLHGPQSKEVGLTLELLVEVFKAGGHWREAHDAGVRALTIMRMVTGSDSLAVATALFTMGELDTHLGQWNEARTHLLEAQRIRRLKMGEVSLENAAVHDALGALALAMGGAGEAVEHYRRALAIHEQTGHAAASGDDLIGVGRGLLLLNQSAQAVQSLERALQLHSDQENPKVVARVKLELGRALWVSGAEQHPRAKQLLVEALSSMREPARTEARTSLQRRGIAVELPATPNAPRPL